MNGHTYIHTYIHTYTQKNTLFARLIRLKIVASGCSQCAWAVGVVTGRAWPLARALNDVISSHCV